jgi:hypothetical protein
MPHQLCREIRHLATLVRMKAYETPELNTENELVELSERMVEAVRAAEYRMSQELSLAE